ncbi:MAG: membrane protein insertion efficiency factor YidD [Pseudomonadota bacterium]
MTSFLIFLITVYQRLFSPILGSNCRFYPTCSHYAKDALRSHGCLNGVILTSCRILRCNPYCEGGIDPVPQQFSLFNKLKPRWM